MNPQEAQAALDSVNQSRSDIADRLYTPWWYHPILGLLIGALATVATSGVHILLLIAAEILCIGGIFLLAWTYRRITGVWVKSYQGIPRSRRSAIRWGMTMVALVFVAAVFSIALGMTWIAPVCGIVVAVWTTVWGRRFDKILRAELRETA